MTVALLAALVTVTLFWQTERLANLGGEALAQDIQDNMADRLKGIELFSTKDLHIAGPGVSTKTFTEPNSAYGYQYSGLYLLQRSGDKYFLLTDGWDTDEARLIVLPDNSGHPRGVRPLIVPESRSGSVRESLHSAVRTWFTGGEPQTPADRNDRPYV